MELALPVIAVGSSRSSTGIMARVQLNRPVLVGLVVNAVSVLLLWGGRAVHGEFGGGACWGDDSFKGETVGTAKRSEDVTYTPVPVRDELQQVIFLGSCRPSGDAD